MEAGNFSIDTAERMSFAAIRCAVYPAKRPVRPQIDFANGERHTARVPPTCDMFGLGPGLEDKRARPIEEPCYHDLAVAGSRNGYGSDVIHC